MPSWSRDFLTVIGGDRLQARMYPVHAALASPKADSVAALRAQVRSPSRAQIRIFYRIAECFAGTFALPVGENGLVNDGPRLRDYLHHDEIVWPGSWRPPGLVDEQQGCKLAMISWAGSWHVSTA